MRTEASIPQINPSIENRFSNGLKEVLQLFRFPGKEGASEKAKLLWLIKLRWVAITLFLALCGPALISGVLSRTTVAEYLGLLGILIVFNLLSQMVLAESKGPIGSFIICFQLACDLLVLSGLLAISGGFDNPFVALFLLNASLGGILIPGRLSWPFLVLTHTLLGTLQFQALVKSKGLLTDSMMGTFAIYHVLVFGCWLVMRSLGSYIERQNTRQSQARVALEKQDRLRSIGALAAGFSHEFASPLNAAKIRLERLQRHQNSEDVSEALAAILSCQRVIEQMNSSQMDTREFHFKTVDVGDLLRDVIESWTEDKSDVRLDVQIQNAITSSVPPLNFAQVILNLLDNAFESAPANTITVRLTRNVEEIQLQIRDEGCGFADTILRQRGEPFITTKPEGTGLGLYVSELFAHSLGGRLELRNLIPQGACVSLCWPAKDHQE